MSGSITYASLLHPDDLKRVAQELAKANASGVVNFSHDDYRIIHPDGEYRWIEDHTRIVRNADGIITHYIGYVVDVTERRQIEKSRRDIYHKDGEGLGLGLPIARRLIEAHAGKIEVESARDKGTTVSIVLPDERVLEGGA